MTTSNALPILQDKAVVVSDSFSKTEPIQQIKTIPNLSDKIYDWFGYYFDLALDKVQLLSNLQANYEQLIVQQFFLFTHVLFFVYAFYIISRSDYKIFILKEIDVEELKSDSKIVMILLAGLLVTGVGLVYITSGFDLQKISANPKVSAKIIVVLVMCLNALVLHLFSIPLLESRNNASGYYASIISITGAISAVSWIYAAFVGLSRVVLPIMSFDGYIFLYEIFMIFGIVVALVTVRPTIKMFLINRFNETYKLRNS
jgi:hypothetical protein